MDGLGFFLYNGFAGLHFPLLFGVDGIMRVSRNSNLAALSLPSLFYISKFLRISRNSGLRDLDFPSLTKVSGDLQILRNPDLVSCSFPYFQFGPMNLLQPEAVAAVQCPVRRHRVQRQPCC